MSAGGLRPGVAVASPSLMVLLVGTTYSALSLVTDLSDIATFRDLFVLEHGGCGSVSGAELTYGHFLPGFLLSVVR